MKPESLGQRLAVCSWSLQPDKPIDLLASLHSLGLNRLQLALDPVRQSPAIWGEVGTLCRDHGVTIVSGMAGCVGEDYTTLETIRRTGGLAPDETWAENLHNFKTVAELASGLGLRLVTLHAGFVPHDDSDPALAKMLDRLAQIAEVFASQDIVMGLETGQETAPDLVHLLRRLDRPNVGVNFDPANMLLYDKGDPVEALRLLRPWIRQVHIKDARRTRIPGTWGEEVPVGTGEVNWSAFFGVLAGGGNSCDLVIEREAGGQRLVDVRLARELVEKVALQPSGGNTQA